MAKRIKVLVSGASGIVGYGIIKSLRKSQFDCTVVGTSNRSFSVANHFSDRFYRAPATGSSNYLSWLLELLERERPDVAIPGLEIDNFVWNRNRNLFDETGTKVLLNDAQLIELSADKWVFFNELRRLHEPTTIETVLVHEYQELVDMFGLPFILKPRRGYGGRGFQVVQNELDFNRGHYPDSIAQPFVGDDESEFTVSAFGDGQGGIAHMFALRRNLDYAGFTSLAEIVESDAFLGPIERLSSSLCPIGPTNFQFRRKGHELFLLEINPRISSSTSIRAAFGYNEVEMGVSFIKTGTIEMPSPKTEGIALRYSEDLVL